MVRYGNLIMSSTWIFDQRYGYYAGRFGGTARLLQSYFAVAFIVIWLCMSWMNRANPLNETFFVYTINAPTWQQLPPPISLPFPSCILYGTREHRIVATWPCHTCYRGRLYPLMRWRGCHGLRCYGMSHQDMGLCIQMGPSACVKQK